MSSPHLIRKEVIMSTTTKAIYFILAIFFLSADVFVTNMMLGGYGGYFHYGILFVCPIMFAVTAMKCLGLACYVEADVTEVEE